MKYLYKYPQNPFPYDDLVLTNRQRSRGDMEYELLDTGVFDSDRYFDVFVEYAKNTPEDILIQISVCNRGPEAATVHVLPTLWFRNMWTWWPGVPKPVLKQVPGRNATLVGAAAHAGLGERFLYCEGEVPPLFTENETNNQRIFGKPNAGPYVKDGIHDAVVSGCQDAVNAEHTGTKASAHYQVNVGAGKAVTIWLRLSGQAPAEIGDPFGSSLVPRCRPAGARRTTSIATSLRRLDAEQYLSTGKRGTFAKNESAKEHDVQPASISHPV
jgi:hypothetical protein